MSNYLTLKPDLWSETQHFYWDKNDTFSIEKWCSTLSCHVAHLEIQPKRQKVHLLAYVLQHIHLVTQFFLAQWTTWQRPFLALHMSHDCIKSLLTINQTFTHWNMMVFTRLIDFAAQKRKKWWRSCDPSFKMYPSILNWTESSLMLFSKGQFGNSVSCSPGTVWLYLYTTFTLTTDAGATFFFF